MASHPQRNTPQHATSRATSNTTPPNAPTALPQPLSLRPASTNPHLPPPTPSTPATTQARARAASFVTALHAHYASLSDTGTPQLFYRLCRVYLEGRAEAAVFYASAYRLLGGTGGEGLLGELREFVPVGWRGMGMEWLEGAGEGDVEIGREGVGDMTTGGGATDREGEEGGGGVRKERQDKRKRRPINGFRSGASPPRASGVFRSTEAKDNEAMDEQDITPDKAASSSTLAPSSGTNQTSNTTRPSEDSPATTTALTRTIYPTRRAILSRPLTKPYIHALCGQRFRHPQDARRHHTGQGGRPGCWERNGKPNREWDEHESCKVTFGDLVVKKVEGGFVVLDWGNATDPDMDKGEEGGENEQRGEDVQMGGEGGQDVKMEEFGVNELEEDAREASEDHDAKRRQVSNGDVPIGDAGFRAVALGLRPRK